MCSKIDTNTKIVFTNNFDHASVLKKELDEAISDLEDVSESGKL